MRSRLAAALLSMTALATAACGPTAAPAWAPSRPGQPQASPSGPLTAAGLVAILQETAALNAQVDTERQKLIAKCMAAKGFRVHPAAVSNVPPFRSPLPEPATWTLDKTQAATIGYGYGETLRNPAPSDSPAAKTAFDNLPPAQQRQYATTRDAQPNGCAAQARKTMIGPSPAPVRFGAPSPSDLLTTPVEQASADKRVTTMLSAWSGCMKKAGYAGLHDVDEAYKMTMRRYGAHGEPPVYTRTRELAEIKQAGADARCREQVTMASVMVTVITERATTLLLKYEQWIVAWRDDARQQLERLRAQTGG
ncbi:hypothetical protein [Hamadaea tsunoensis]|uniref:hypothetical protein n=1 Tax=Hamadaea tsunoensis TaxID=53368 RepID=UPI000423074B|nr:hypothetical protein [Hamadaea tsunoensis]